MTRDPGAIVIPPLFKLPAIVPESPDYEAARRVWNWFHDLRPAAVIRCSSTPEIAAGVRFAAERGLPLAVRGGGHSFPGYGCCDGGIVLDLSPMSSVAVDRDRRAASVGGGATWADVDHVTAAASLARFFVMRNRAVGLGSEGASREFIQADRGERQLNKIMETLAVVTATGDIPFAHLIASDGIRLNRNDTVLAVSADPNPEWAVALQHIQRRGVNSIAVVIDGSTFGRKLSYAPLLGQLEAAGVPAYRLARNDRLEHVLSNGSGYRG